jgi:Putative lumazine-binding
MIRNLTKSLATILGLAAALLSPTGLHAQSDADAIAVRATIQAFADGAATQDVALLERTLHPASVQYITGKEVRGVDRTTYLAAIRDKKMGGLPMTVTIQQVQVDGSAAQAHATFAAAPFSLSHALSLVKVEGRWVIVSTVVSVIPKDSAPARAPG